MNKRILALSSVFAVAAFLQSMPSIANEPGTMDKVEANTKEAVQDTKKGAKKLGRKMKDETCEMINGKMECAAKRMGNKIKNGVDEVKDKAND